MEEAACLRPQQAGHGRVGKDWEKVFIESERASGDGDATRLNQGCKAGRFFVTDGVGSRL